uniref:Uncharacterized protein n=1 Tax=Sander lucioperca TaxID=283035 RepID=A0A8C9XLV3_SANLU
MTDKTCIVGSVSLTLFLLSLFLNLFQIAFMTVTLFPIRLLIAAFMMLLAWPFAFLASVGRSETTVEPQCLWRRWVLCYAFVCLSVLKGNFVF